MNRIRHCQVLGPFNSGTTLMQRHLGYLYRNSAPGCFPYWKHSLWPALYVDRDDTGKSVPPPGDFPDVLFVCMVRSPYFWSISCCNRPYDLKFLAGRRDLGSRLRCPVVFRRRQRLPNIIQLWNDYYRAYAAHLESRQVMYVRLEDLVRRPIDVMEKLDRVLEREPGRDPARWSAKISASPMKPLNAFGDLWEERNRTEHLSSTIPGSDLAFINSQLDPVLMRRFGYPPVWTTPEVG